VRDISAAMYDDEGAGRFSPPLTEAPGGRDPPAVPLSRVVSHGR
jgi:hypothetical protein